MSDEAVTLCGCGLDAETAIFVARQLQAEMGRQVELMEAGKFAIHEAIGSEMVDTTAAAIADTRRRIAELDDAIAQARRQIGLEDGGGS